MIVSESREVAIVLALKASPDNARAAAQVSGAVETAEKNATKSVEAAAAKQQQVSDRVMSNRIKLLAKMQAADAKTAAEQAKAAERTAKAVEAAAKKAADAQAREAAKATAAAEKEAARQVAIAKKAADDKVKAEAKAAAELEKQQAKQVRDYETAVAGYHSAQEALDGANIKVMESGAKAAQGILDIAEGAAILGLASEKDLEKFVRGFAKFQALFKGLKGGIDLFVGVVEVIKAMRVATDMATASQLALNAAQALGGGAGAAAGAAGNVAVKAGTGAVASAAGGAVAGGAATAGGAAIAGGGGGVVASVMSTIGSVAVTFAQVAAGGLALYEGVTGLARAFGFVNDRTESFVGALLSWRKAAVDAKNSEKGVKQQQENFNQGSVDRARDRYAAGTQGRKADAQRDELLFGEKEGLKLQRERAVLAKAAAEEDLKNAGMLRISEDARAEKQNMAREAAKQAGEEIRQADERAQQSAQRRVESAKQELALAREKLKTNSDEIDQERDRQKSRLAAFGQLNASQQKGLKEVNDKLQAGGDLSRQDAKLLQSTGFGGEHLNNYYAQQGSAAGGQGVVNFLEGGEDKMANLEADRHGLMEDVNRATREYRDAQDELKMTTNELVESLKKFRQAVDDEVKEKEQARNNGSKETTGAPGGNWNGGVGTPQGAGI